MPEGFANPVGRRAAMAIAIAAAAWLCYAGVMHGLAGHYAASSSPEDWSRASRIEPANGENWYRLGRYRHLDFDQPDVPLAISYYLRAVQLNPRSAFYKLDLASALEISGEDAEAEKYYRAAQENYPISAEVSWKYGNFLLRQQRLPEAYAQIHRAVVVDSKLTPLAISRAWHSSPDVHVLLDQVLPDTAEGDWGALTFLTEAQQSAAALTVWNRLIARKPPMIWKNIFPFLDMLIAQERYDDAGSAWHQATAIAGFVSTTSEGNSLVFDGGFEREPLGGGFGWHRDDVAGADFDFDTAEKHSGARSLAITFDGTQNLAFQALYQTIFAVPGTHYRFRGYLRTDHISTESGMRFEIFDPKDQKNVDILTSNQIGTTPWTLEETDFTTGPKTHMIRIRLTRVPSTHLDNTLRGTVWVDDVELVPVETKK